MRPSGLSVCQHCWVLVIVVVKIANVSASCGGSVFNATTISETDQPVKVLLRFPAEANITWKMNLEASTMAMPRPDQIASRLDRWLNSRVVLNTSTGTDHHEVQLVKSIDLEDAYETLKAKLGIIIYKITCESDGSPEITDQWFLEVRAVNEFVPEFVAAPFNLTIPENTVAGTQVIRLKDNATDRDVAPSESSDLKEFSMMFLPKMPNDPHDNILSMDDRVNGQINVAVRPDFESFQNASSAFVVYNITVFDMGQWNSSSTITVYITDVDDLPPKFYFPGCETDPCAVFYTCEVAHNFTGTVSNITPANIMARDGDTLGYVVRYRLKTGPQQPKFRNFVQIDEGSGVVSITAALEAYHPQTEIGIVIEAYEVPPPNVRTASLASTVSLILRIRYPAGSLTSPAPQGASASNGGVSSPVIVALAVLAVFGVLALVVIGALVLYFKNRPDKPIYPAEDGEELEGDVDSNDDDTAVDSPPPVQTHFVRTQPPESQAKSKPQKPGSNTDSGQWSMNGGSGPTPAHHAGSAAPTQTRLPHGQAPPPGIAQQRQAQLAVAVGVKPKVAKMRAKSARAPSRRSDGSSGGESMSASGRVSIGDIHTQADGQPGQEEDWEATDVHSQMFMNSPEYAGILLAQMQGAGDGMHEVGATGGRQGSKQRRLPPKSAPPGGRRSSRKQRREQKVAKRKDEKFDGTKVYPMGADSSFFTEGNKSKVKLSPRKRQQQPLDPRCWMTVDNEYLDM